MHLCHGTCIEVKKGLNPYSKGYGRCSVCEVWYNYYQPRCSCCGTKVSYKPRKGGFKYDKIV